MGNWVLLVANGVVNLCGHNDEWLDILAKSRVPFFLLNEWIIIIVVCMLLYVLQENLVDELFFLKKKSYFKFFPIQLL